MPANRLRGQIAALLFGSGFCALVYQICWLREFRLIFGASTAATAAVTAIFIGGLGLGGIVIGRRADRHSNPLMLYGNLEVWIALSSAASPLLLFLVRSLYIGLGGTVVLGVIAGTVLRLVLAGLVLSVPTLLMGGTLPAAARAAETDDDTGRRSVALLYGANTLGAVAGCLTANFFMLETFGNRSALWIAACLNVLVALLARNLARAKAAAEPEVSAVGPLVPQPAVQRLVITAAAVVGFAFFLMELVWYRMLGPLLSGTIFSFGLILAVALLGIGLGGLFYALAIPNRRATLRAFAYTCLAEAFFVALPLALGDRIAILALLVRPLGTVGLVGFAAGWAVVALLVVLPAAFTAGFQFPLLIALLGPGRENVGREVGLVYVANTAGAIVGSLAGGFGLLPILSAPGCWRAVAALLLALSAAAFVTSLRNGSRRLALLAPAATALIVIGFLTATGPTAVWRHSQIGVGRVALETIKTPGQMRQWTNYRRRATVWEAEGVESSVALDATGGFAFVLNGRTDGNAVADGSTQVMGGLLGAAFHSHPQRSMVIGLGTGSTAGWLASVPGMERVDVVELEPAILHVAEVCAPVNRNALRNRKVHVTFADARELLLTTRERYDIIFSEPSNPFRAGVASLFTREFYRAVAARLRPEGIFIQWVQGYEVDPRTIRTVYATLASAFPFVETWQLSRGDLALVASARGLHYDVPALRARIREEAFASALASTWRVADLEGFLSHYLARASMARAVAGLEDSEINTDDRNSVEFGFARGAGRESRFDVNDLKTLARRRREDRPEVTGGEVDWMRVEEERWALDGMANVFPPLDPGMPLDQEHRVQAQRDFLRGNLAKALAEWRAQPREPSGPRELSLVAQCLAEAADEAAVRYLAELRHYEPAEADVILGRLRLRQGRFAESAAALASGFRSHQSDPWPSPSAMRLGFASAEEIADRDKTLTAGLFGVLGQPFSVMSLQEDRNRIRLALAFRLERKQVCFEALQPLEPFVPWTLPVLSWRNSCYQETSPRNVPSAARDLEEYLEQQAVPFGKELDESRPERQRR